MKFNIKPLVIALSLISLTACDKQPTCDSLETKQLVSKLNAPDDIKKGLISYNESYVDTLNALSVGFSEGLGNTPPNWEELVNSLKDKTQTLIDTKNTVEVVENISTKKEDKLKDKIYCEMVQESYIKSTTKYTFNQLFYDINQTIEPLVLNKMLNGIKDQLNDMLVTSGDIKNTVTILGDGVEVVTIITRPSLIEFTTAINDEGKQSVVPVKGFQSWK